MSMSDFFDCLSGLCGSSRDPLYPLYDVPLPLTQEQEDPSETGEIQQLTIQIEDVDQEPSYDWHKGPRVLRDQFEFYFYRAPTFFASKIQDPTARLFLLTEEEKFRAVFPLTFDAYHTTYLASMEAIHVLLGNQVDWNVFAKTKHPLLEKAFAYRYCALALTMLCVSLMARAVKEKNGTQVTLVPGRPRRIYNERAMGVVAGSATLLSDIDVTVDAIHASSFIALMEDLWISTGWFDHTKFHMDLYADFMLMHEYYFNTHHLSTPLKQKMLRLAILSYFRHPLSATFDTTVLQYLIRQTSTTLPTSLKQIEADATHIDPDDREEFYKRLVVAEKAEQALSVEAKTAAVNPQLADQIGTVLLALAEADLYRGENYVLATTTVHIVKVEQTKVPFQSNCVPSLLTKFANCSLSPFTYTLSAIEQLGYMQQALAEKKLDCSLPANKYFGRLLRALKEMEDGIVKDEILYDQLVTQSQQLAMLKKERGDKGEADCTCAPVVPLYAMLKKLFKLRTK